MITAPTRVVHTAAQPAWPAELFDLRGCTLCVHATTVAGERHCACPQAVLPGRTVPVHLVRAPTGSCGPNGAFIDLPSWRT